MRRIYVTLAAFASMVFILSCQKEIHEIEEIVSKCRIETGFYNSLANDSATFTYTADSKLSKVENEMESWQYFYTGDKITTRKQFDRTTNELMYVDTIEYDGNNIKAIRAYDYGTFFDSVFVKVNFVWQNNRLTRINTEETYPSAGITQNYATRVHHNTTGNIEKLVYLDEFDEAYDSIQYKFDAQPNFFKLAHPHFIIFDPFFQIHVGFEAHLAYAYSTNNVTGFAIYGGGYDYEVTYNLDSANNLTSVMLDGDEFARYRYSCR